MARAAGYSARGGLLRMRGWGEALSGFEGRISEACGFLLVVASLLLLLALFTYERADPSLDTASGLAPHNFLGPDGAILADLLRQTLGLAAYLIPAVLLGWAFRLLLNRGLKPFWRKLALSPTLLALAAFALSLFDLGTGRAASGGALGWELQRLLLRAGFAAHALPVAMAAAAFVGLLLLVILGLSWRDWRDLDRKSVV